MKTKYNHQYKKISQNIENRDKKKDNNNKQNNNKQNSEHKIIKKYNNYIQKGSPDKIR